MSETLERAIYPSRDGIEILQLGQNAGVPGTSLAPWSIFGPQLPLPRAVDCPISPDGQTAVYPVTEGFQVINIGSGTCAFCPYAGSGHGTTPIPLGVDPVISSDSRLAIYPSDNNIEILDLAAFGATALPYAGTGPVDGLIPCGVDFVINPSTTHAVYPTGNGFQVVDLNTKTATEIPFGGVGPNSLLPIDVDAMFHIDGTRLVYPTPTGMEQLSLADPAASTFFPWRGVGPNSLLPIGVDPIVATHAGTGQPPVNQAFSNDDPGDEDLLASPTEDDTITPPWGPGPPGAPRPSPGGPIPRHLTCGEGQPCTIEQDPGLVAELTTTYPGGYCFVEAPHATERVDGLSNKPLSFLGMTLDSTTGRITGSLNQTGEFLSVIHVFTPDKRSFLTRIPLLIWSIPHIEWVLPWRPGAERFVQIGAEIDIDFFGAIMTLMEAPPGTASHQGQSNVTFDSEGLTLNGYTQDIQGVRTGEGEKFILLRAINFEDEVIGELWVRLVDSAPPENPLRLLSIQQAGGAAVDITWTANDGAVCAVEGSADLTAWTQIPGFESILVTQPVIETSLTGLPGGEYFLRIAEISPAPP